jgi:hypothetical protein
MQVQVQVQVQAGAGLASQGSETCCWNQVSIRDLEIDSDIKTIILNIAYYHDSF